jgi:SsrA-binding protein
MYSISVRLNSFSITGSYIKIKSLECWLVKSFIKVRASTLVDSVLENRDRKLLLHIKEIKNLIGLLNLRHYTLVPSKVYWKNNFLKLEILNY